MNKYIRLIPLVLLSVFSIKVLVSGAELPDAVALGVFACLAGFFEYKLREQRLDQLEKDIQEYKQMSQDDRKILNELRTYVSASKLSGVRTVNNVGQNR